MPLNRLTVRETDYPQTDAALPMVTKLQYAERFDKAMRYIFGKTMICRNLEVATHLARTTGLDCVTLDGDQVSSKGNRTTLEFLEPSQTNEKRPRLAIKLNELQHKRWFL